MNKTTFSEYDLLNLKPFAKNLFNDIEKGIISPIGEQGAYTISLNAEFGNGKTTFLRMFENFINNEKENYNVLFIDAWRSDFYGEPIIAILSELANYMKENDEKNKKEITKAIGKISIAVGKQIVQHRVGINFKEATDSLKVGENLLKNFKQRKSVIEKIQKDISEYIEYKKLIIIVDELDRTRPDYAIRFLEDMKHFFDIKNLAFLIAVNKKQMEATVKCLYGQDSEDSNFNGYYRKFFKQEIDLPDPYKEVQKFIDNLIQKTKVKYETAINDRYDQATKDSAIQNSYVSCKMFRLTLREIEHFINLFDKILRNENKSPKWTDVACYPFFICLFIKEKEIFNEMLNRDFTINKFFKFINKKGIKYIFNTNEETRFEYKTNLLLVTVAHSFIKDQSSLEQDKKDIQGKFGALIDAHRFFTNGFTLNYGQPALDICEKINQFESVFNE